MDINVFNELVDRKYITEVGMVDYYKKNEDKMEELTVDGLADIITVPYVEEYNNISNSIVEDEDIEVGVDEGGDDE